MSISNRGRSSNMSENERGNNASGEGMMVLISLKYENSGEKDSGGWFDANSVLNK